jgi:hypothetical protein
MLCCVCCLYYTYGILGKVTTCTGTPACNTLEYVIPWWLGVYCVFHTACKAQTNTYVCPPVRCVSIHALVEYVNVIITMYAIPMGKVIYNT